MKTYWIVAVALIFVFMSGNNAVAGQERGKVVISVGDDLKNKKSEIKYFLQRRDATLVPLTREHSRDYPPLRSGQRAILSPSGKLHYFKNKHGITFNKVNGEIRVLIALIQPSDEDAPWEAEKAKEYFQSSKDFFEDPKQHSKVILSVKTVGWIKSQKTKNELTSSANGNFVTSAVISEATELIDDSVNFQEIDCIFVVVADNDWTWSWAWSSAFAAW